MSRARAVQLLAAAGALAGVAAKAADESGWRWAADLGSQPAAWLLAVAAVARLSPTAPSAAAGTAVFFASMTAAYYAWADLVQGAGPAVWPLAVTWWLLSVTAVPAYALVVRSASLWPAGRWSPAAGAALALAGGLALAEGVAPDQPVQVVASVVAALVVTTALPVQVRTRAWALALLAPGALLAAAALSAARGAHLLP
ncbi:hypothetical protein FHN55_15650 [Streptomyces sp. NP160]|uniref:hypothetical protein n=1 Tax=Streptomyces sp. NP160 TaxID=2586637 RepID=UPI001117EC62|nr:hypothetical protein [Streptomyces sp. NP160]TNM63261.1 hypothetical protein FHN55_15650 [Streptomyces sp. NP160]